MAIATNAIIDVAQAKQYLRITDPDWDEIIEIIINSVSSAAERYLHRLVKQQTVTDERINGPGSRTLRPTYAPIISVTTVYDSATWTWDADSLVDAGNYYLDTEAGKLVYAIGYIWTKGTRNIKLTYVVGWATVPTDITMGVRIQVAEEFRKYKEQRLDRISSTRGDGSVTYAQVEWVPQALLYLDPYKLMVIG